MKHLKKSASFLSLVLLCASPVYLLPMAGVVINDHSHGAAAYAASSSDGTVSSKEHATSTVKHYFNDVDDLNSANVTTAELLNALATLVAACASSDHNAHSIVATILENLSSLPVELQDFFGKFDNASLIRVIHLRQAIEEFDNFVSPHPRYLLKWPDFVKRITTLLSGTPRYHEVVADFKGVINSNRLVIGATLKKHFKMLPRHTRDAASRLGAWEISKRVTW